MSLNPKDVVIVDAVRTPMGKSRNGMFRERTRGKTFRAADPGADGAQPGLERRRNRRRDLGLRQPDQGTGHEHRPQHRHAGRPAAHQRRANRQPPVRLLHAGPACRHASDHDRQRRHLRDRRRGAHGPRSHGPRRGPQPRAVQAHRPCLQHDGPDRGNARPHARHHP